MRFRGYNLVLFGLIGAFLSLVAFLAATLEPNTGDRKLRVSALLGQSGVRILPMGDLRRFTSRDQSLLVYGYAVPRGDSGSVDLPRSACGLRNLVAFAARELGAPLVPFFAANKLSIYAPDIPGAPASDQGFLPRLIEASGLPVPRLSEALREAVEAGQPRRLPAGRLPLVRCGPSDHREGALGVSPRPGPDRPGRRGRPFGRRAGQRRLGPLSFRCPGCGVADGRGATPHGQPYPRRRSRPYFPDLRTQVCVDTAAGRAQHCGGAPAVCAFQSSIRSPKRPIRESTHDDEASACRLGPDRGRRHGPRPRDGGQLHLFGFLGSRGQP